MGIGSRVRSLFKGPEEFDLTSGGIGKPLFFLSMPIVITNLFQTAYNLADTFWLGQYSTDALAAISFAFPMVFLLISLGMGISVAGSVLVAQFTGAGEEREAEYAASQTVTFAVIVSFGLGIVGYLGVDTFPQPDGRVRRRPSHGDQLHGSHFAGSVVHVRLLRLRRADAGLR